MVKKLLVFVLVGFSISCYARTTLEQVELIAAVTRGITGTISYACNEQADQLTNSTKQKAAIVSSSSRLMHDALSCYNHWQEEAITHLVPWLLFDCWRLYKSCGSSKEKTSLEESKNFSLISGLSSIGRLMALGIQAYACVDLVLKQSLGNPAAMLSITCALESLMESHEKDSFLYAEKSFAAGMLCVGLLSFVKRDFSVISQMCEQQNKKMIDLDNQMKEALSVLAVREEKIREECNKLLKEKEKKLAQTRKEHNAYKKRFLEIKAENDRIIAEELQNAQSKY